MKKRDIAKLLAQPNVAVLAVITPDGAPHAVPIWYEFRQGQVFFITDSTSYKCRCMMRDPRVALCVDIRKPPYKAVVLKGRATMEEKTDDRRLERMAVAYLGKRAGEKYARDLKGQPLVVVHFKPDRVLAWDYSEEK